MEIYWIIISNIATFIGGYLVALSLKNRVDVEEHSEENACRHGYEDWDDCPDCGH